MRLKIIGFLLLAGLMTAVFPVFSFGWSGVDYDNITLNSGLLGGWDARTVNASSYPVFGDIDNFKNILISQYSHYDQNLNNSELWEMNYCVAWKRSIR